MKMRNTNIGYKTVTDKKNEEIDKKNTKYGSQIMLEKKQNNEV